MKKLLLVFAVLSLTLGMYGQDYKNGSIITVRYDTISNVKIEKMSDAKSLLHLTYVDANGVTQHPDIATIKCYSRGSDVFCRIFYTGEMVLVKQLVAGEKLNLYARNYNGRDVFFVEKVYDELIKVPSADGKFRKVMSEFLEVNKEIADKIKSKELVDINDIVAQYNASL